MNISNEKIHWGKNHFQKIMFQIEMLRDDLEDEKLQVSREEIKKRADELMRLGEEHVKFLHNLADDNQEDEKLQTQKAQI